jgi:hypothetical protein
MSASRVPGSPERDALALELEALETIARAIDSLPDGARARVLRWACERCNVIDVFAPAALAVAPPAEPIDPRLDPALSVDALDDLFGPSIPHQREWRHEEPVVAASFDIDDVIAEPAVQPAQTPPPLAPETPQTAKSLLDGFVRDFQQLVVEWEGAA